MERTWQVSSNDDLDGELTVKAVAFLETFRPVGADPTWSVDYFRWKLGEANPAGRGFMTLAVHEEDVVGVTTVTRKRMWDGQGEVKGAEIGDVYSHVDFRRESRAERPYPPTGTPDEYLSRSVFGRLATETRERAESAGVTLIYATPNGNSMPGFVKRLGYFDYTDHFNQHFVRPGPAALQRWPLSLGPFQRAVYTLDQVYVRLSRRFCGDLGRWQAHEVEDIGEEIERLWQRLKGGADFGLLRDAAYFRHRFLENPLSHYRIWTVSRGGLICGVFVTRIISQVGGNLGCYLADWLLDPAEPGLFRFVVAHMLSENHRPEFRSYSFWAEKDWAAKQGFLRLGFVGRGRVPIIYSNHPDGRALAASGRKLDFTLATSDNI